MFKFFFKKRDPFYEDPVSIVIDGYQLIAIWAERLVSAQENGRDEGLIKAAKEGLAAALQRHKEKGVRW
ncbi:MAG: hypothetical protein AB1830_14140 [Pseudomonadota bacterium]